MPCKETKNYHGNKNNSFYKWFSSLLLRNNEVTCSRNYQITNNTLDWGQCMLRDEIMVNHMVIFRISFFFFFTEKKSCFFIYFFNYTILYWFCHTSKWIRHRYTCVPHPEPSSLRPPHTIPLGRPSALAPSIQYRASNMDWQLVSYMILYMFQCHSPKSSHLYKKSYCFPFDSLNNF